MLEHWNGSLFQYVIKNTSNVRPLSQKLLICWNYDVLDFFLLETSGSVHGSEPDRFFWLPFNMDLVCRGRHWGMACVAIFYTGLCFPEGANLSPITLVIIPQLCSPRMTSHQFGAKTATGPPSHPSPPPIVPVPGCVKFFLLAAVGQTQREVTLGPSLPRACSLWGMDLRAFPC